MVEVDLRLPDKRLRRRQDRQIRHQAEHRERQALVVVDGWRHARPAGRALVPVVSDGRARPDGHAERCDAPDDVEDGEEVEGVAGSVVYAENGSEE